MVKPRKISFKYPKPRRDETISENLHGVEVPDPYRWLENPHSVETRDFVVSQNELSKPYLEDYLWRDQVRDNVKNLLNFPKHLTPTRRGSNYYQKRNTGLLNQDVLYILDSLDSEGRVFFDPNKLSVDGTIALADVEFSNIGEYMAYSLSSSGSDWVTIKFRNTRLDEDLRETLYKVKYSGMSWSKYDSGIFYSGYLSEKETTYFGISTKKVEHQKLYFHRLNTDQERDVLVAEFEDAQMLVSGLVSNCGDYLLVFCRKACQNNLLYYASLIGQEQTNYSSVKLVPVITELDASYTYVHNVNEIFLFKTDKDAPNCRLVSVDFSKEEGFELKDVIPEHEKYVFEWAKPINHDHLVVCYLIGGDHNLHIFTLDGKKMLDINLEPGTINDVSGQFSHKELFFTYTSYLKPNVVYKIDFNKISPEATIIYESKISGFNPGDFVCKQVFYTSKDGTEIPMSILHKKDLNQDGRNPCILYGYGGFGFVLTPMFKALRIVFSENFRGVCAIANVRGGGEYGEKWHDSGRILNKQNSFDDFQFAARYLIRNNYTNPSLLAIHGVSNGGLLAAVCMNQSPELYGAVIISVGVLDMLRYHKFTIGFAWVSDYGSPEVPEQFQCIYLYSPLHNIKEPPNSIGYPATLLLTADHDDRVVPSHSLKFIAELQNKIGSLSQQTQPLIIKVDTKAGHGNGKPTSKIIEEVVDTLTFVAKALSLKFHDS